MGVSIGLIARTVRGVEYVAADEIAAEIATLAPASIALSSREVTFRADGQDPGLRALRTLDDIFLSVGSVGGAGHRKDAVPWLAEQARLLDWRRAVAAAAELRELPAAGRFDVVTSLLGRRNYSRYDVEDGVGAALSEGLGRQYVSRRGHAGEVPPTEFTVRVFISGDRARFALRLADRPLHRRGYKQHATHGTLHPPMAAALARVLAAGAGEVVADPFCGDGTIPIEIAAIAPGAEVHGCDRDPARVQNAAANATQAKADISCSVADAGALEFADGSVDVLATNPPWNLAVDASGMLAGGFGPFWGEAERVMSPAGRMGVIMDAGFGTVNDLGRRGFEISLVQSVRLAGRLCEIVVCAPPGCPRWELPGGISRWRQEALAVGLATDTGFEPRGR